ncbi:uncharacterized protein LOC124431954 [Vespa crabro]|uniref:uncharacterized protein LOC124431954 n=1 Tax=Vespa crabro TaxID=7445 RepID=UPI001F0177F9|nr:uncharacterized protein LOC124431954 [Vespa crabro]
MKLAVVLVAILAVANAWVVPNYDNSELKKDLQEFVNLVPVDKIKKLVLQYVAEDAEVQKGVAYAHSTEFKSLVQEVDAMPEYINLLNYIYRAGVDIYYYVNLIHKWLDLPELKPPKDFSEYALTGGYKGLVEDVKKLIPKDQIKALYRQKLETSPAFKELMDHFNSSEFKELYDAVYKDPRVKHMITVAKQSGLDLEKLKEFIKEICPICIELMKYHLTFLASLILIGVSAYPLNNDWSMNELDHDIIDFYNIMPVDQILKIAEKYRSDPEIAATMKYATSDEFHRLLYAVEDLQEYKKFVLYLQEAGYNKIREMKTIHLLLKMKDYVPPQPSNLMVEAGYGGLNGFINEIVAILPKEKIQELHQQKLVKSSAFAKFNSYILSEKYVQLENALNSKNEYKELKERSNAAGLDIQAIENFKYQLLGIQKCINICFVRITVHSSLSSCDINYCVPFRKIISTTMKYVFTFFATLIVVGVSAIPLNGDRTDLLNGNRSDTFIDNLLGIFNGNNKEENPLDKDLLDFARLIPQDKLNEIAKKYVNDSQLIKQHEYVTREEFHNLVYAVEALPEHQKYVLYIQKSGYDKIREIQWIHSILGMKDYVPPNPSNEVFKKNDKNNEGGLNGFVNEIVAILPVKEIKELHEKKLKESKAFAKFVSYIQSEKLHKIWKELIDKEPTKEMLGALKMIGINYMAVLDLQLRVVGIRS